MHVDNLMWVTPSERVQHSYDLGQMNTLEKNGKPCPRCGNLMLYGPVCSDCRQEFDNLKRRLQTRMKIKEPIRKAFENIDKYKPKYQEVIRRRFRGETLRDISEYLGVTHQYVSIMQKQIIEGEPSAFK